MSTDTPGGTNIEGEGPVVEETVETDEATITDDAELERTLGLTGGLAIGIGTMIGAGIFVFPGLAAGQAGPAAAGSFAIGMVVALLLALPTSELATAMPKNGGGYYFISRGLGALAGTVVGLSLWFGLVFATAFYLVGFGYYAVAALAPVRRRGRARRQRDGRAGPRRQARGRRTRGRERGGRRRARGRGRHRRVTADA